MMKQERHSEQEKQLVTRPEDWSTRKPYLENYLYTRYVPREIREAGERYEREHWGKIAEALERIEAPADAVERLHQDYRNVLYFENKPLTLTLADMYVLVCGLNDKGLTASDIVNLDEEILFKLLYCGAYLTRWELSRNLRRACFRLSKARSVQEIRKKRERIEHELTVHAAAAQDLESDFTKSTSFEFSTPFGKIAYNTQADYTRYFSFLFISAYVLGQPDKIQFVTPPPYLQMYAPTKIRETIQRARELAKSTQAKKQGQPTGGKISRDPRKCRTPQTLVIAPALAQQARQASPIIKQRAKNGAERVKSVFDIAQTRKPHEISTYKSGEILPAYAKDKRGYLYGYEKGKRTPKYLQERTGEYYRIYFTPEGEEIRGEYLGATPPPDLIPDKGTFNICIEEPKQGGAEDETEITLQPLTYADWGGFLLTLCQLANGEIQEAGTPQSDYIFFSINERQLLQRYTDTGAAGGREYRKLNALFELCTKNEFLAATDLIQNRAKNGRPLPGYVKAEIFRPPLIVAGHDVYTDYNGKGEEIGRETFTRIGILKYFVQAAPRYNEEAQRVEYHTRYYLNAPAEFMKLRKRYARKAEAFANFSAIIASCAQLSESKLIAELSAQDKRIIESEETTPAEKAKARRNINKHRPRTLQTIDTLFADFVKSNILQSWGKRENQRGEIVYYWSKANPTRTGEEQPRADQ